MSTKNYISSQFRQVNDILGKVRKDDELYSLKGFILPNEALIKDLAFTLYHGGNFVKDAQDFVHNKVKYIFERGDYWQFPLETLDSGRGDCEDTSILLCSILRNYIPPEEVYCVAGDWKGDGHCWVVANWNIIETTANSRKSIVGGYKPEVFFNDQCCWIGESSFGFVTVSKRYYFLCKEA